MKLSKKLIDEMALNMVFSSQQKTRRHIVAGGLIQVEPTNYVEYRGIMKVTNLKIARELSLWENSKKMVEEIELIRNNMKMIIRNCYPQCTFNFDISFGVFGQTVLHIEEYKLQNYEPSWEDWFIVEEKEYATK